MAQWTEEQLQAWYSQHGPEKARHPVFRTQPVQTTDPITRLPTTENQSIQVGEEIEAQDGAKIQVMRLPESGQPNKPDYEIIAHDDTTDTPKPTPRTPEQQRTEAAQATTAERANADKQREDDERSWNQFHTNEGGSGLPETHLERATREARVREEQRQQQQLADQEAQQQRAAAAQEEANRQRELDRAEQARQFGVSSGTSAASQAETVRHNQVEENRPQFLPSDTKAPKISQINPSTGQITSVDNPNFDPVKAAAEEKRLELASQIASRQINLEEAKQQYSQWFDTNVKTPLMMAQEQRAKAEEQRAALDAEERRRQFAATFGLQKASLGQQAAATAIQAEESLLPYRAGPNEAAHMSDAINSLAAGGHIGGPSAGAGIHFSGEDFQFNAPDFKKIAAEATKQVLSGLTDYRPSNDTYQTADYSGVPAVNLGGMPSYSYGGSSLPTPTPGADQPTG